VGSSVTGHTWVADAARGATFDRFMAFVGDDGARHISARTTWALIDKATGRPLRVRADMVAQFRPA
ncbi:MAG: acyl-CoA thioesterase, partial [Sphingopyxis sp.]